MARRTLHARRVLHYGDLFPPLSLSDNMFLTLGLSNPTQSAAKPPQTLVIYSRFPPFPKVKYKSDLNLTRGVGWTPPGSYKVEMARRAAELANARNLGLQGAYVSSKL